MENESVVGDAIFKEQSRTAFEFIVAMERGAKESQASRAIVLPSEIKRKVFAEYRAGRGFIIQKTCEIINDFVLASVSMKDIRDSRKTFS